MELEMKITSNRENRSNIQYSNKDTPDQLDHKERVERKKRGNFLLRQELSSFTPDCNPTVAIVFNVIVTLVFLGLGFPMILLSEGIKEYQFDYTGWYIYL
jgi:hypothetical protein